MTAFFATYKEQEETRERRNNQKEGETKNVRASWVRNASFGMREREFLETVFLVCGRKKERRKAERRLERTKLLLRHQEEACPTKRGRRLDLFARETGKQRFSGKTQRKKNEPGMIVRPTLARTLYEGEDDH